MTRRRAIAWRTAAVTAALSVVPMSPAADRGPPLSPRYTGVNIASGGFADQRIPGRYGYDYFYPTAEEAAPFLAAGMNAVRVPLLWERIQPVPGQPLDKAEMQRLDESLRRLAGFRLIVLDVHNYASYRGVKLDRPGRTGAMLAELWRMLADRYRTNPRIAFGLMNEPVDISAAAWRGIAGEALAAIRATGARNLVLVPGTRWTGAHVWTEGGAASNGAVMADLRDPADNIAFEMHLYADADSSGTHETCVAPAAAAARLAAATGWLRAHRARGFLGEFGTAPGADCLAALDAMLDAIDDASDVWLGWTYWAGGAMWGPYPMSIQPDARGPKPQLAVLRRHLAK